MHFQVGIILTLQEAAEYCLVSLLEDANLCMIHTKCVPIMPMDIQLACHVHKEHLYYCLLTKVCFCFPVTCRLCGRLPVQGKGVGVW